MISDSIFTIAKKLQGHMLDPDRARDEISMFLCGGSSRKDSLVREALGRKLANVKSKYSYTVHYPETLFLELLLGHKRHDLLILETILASSVSAVVIPLQSPGTFTELGAFANHDRLQNKLIIVIEPRYKLVNSFINAGPIRHLRLKTTSVIIYHGLDVSSVDSLAKPVSEAARRIHSLHPITPSVINPITSADFYFALTLVLEPCPRAIVGEIAGRLYPSDPMTAATVAETVVNGLINRRMIVSRDGELRVPQQSAARYISGITTEKKREELRVFLSGLRFQAMNHIYRRNRVAWRRDDRP